MTDFKTHTIPYYGTDYIIGNRWIYPIDSDYYILE